MMNYQSTRSAALQANALQAVLQGLAPDGGLYTMPDPSQLRPDLDAILALPPMEMASAILDTLLPDYGSACMRSLTEKAYAGKFETPELTPLVPVGENYVLELFRGPTSAFKDVALSMLPQLLSEAKRRLGVQEEILILTATSGDTGKAAMAGFRDVPGIRIIVFYPENGVSPVQKAQMVTQEGRNVRVCAVKGNFDDAQSAVKRIFDAEAHEHLFAQRGVRLSSANSINIGRLAPQVVYYFRAYAELLHAGRIACGDKVHFSVPTGNFGDILAGWLAKQLGLPVGTLVCASNENNVLTEFLQTGRYDRRRPFHQTVSPSMDILISSNLERLLFLMSRDEALVAGLMEQLRRDGVYTVPAELKQKLDLDFFAACCTDEATRKTIGEVWQKDRYLMDTHTAVAWNAAQAFRRESGSAAPMVVLSTASAYKFPRAVLEGLGQMPAGDDFAVMEQLHARTGVPVPRNLSALQGKPVLHTDVQAPEALLSYVLSQAEDAAWNR